jgi:hypothetical protein
MTASNAVLERAILLRRVLWLDAATCIAMALFLMLLAQPLAPLLGLPAALLEGAGAVLVPVAAFIAWVATRAAFLRPGTWLVVAGNAAWVAASAGLLAVSELAVTPMGFAFVTLQASAVTLLAILEYLGVSRL